MQRRTLTLTALLGLLAALLVAPVAHASTSTPSAPDAPAQTVSPFAGNGTAELLTVDSALPVAGLGVTDISLTPVATNVSTAETPRSSAVAQNLQAELLDALDLSDLLSQASQTAPPDNAEPASTNVIELPDNPLLDLAVSESTAWARWPGDGVCLAPGEPLAEALTQTASATVLPLPDPVNGSLVTVDNSVGGATATTNAITTEEVAGQSGRSLVSTSQTQIDSVTLLQGTPLELSLEIAGTPSLVATATGSPGGATVEYNAPVVEVTAPETSSLPNIGDIINLGPLNPLGEAVDTLTDSLEEALLDALGEAGVVNVDILLGEETLNTNTSPDGTGAIGTASVARIEIQVLAAIGDPLIDAVIDVGPMSAAVAVPQGGIICDGPFDNPLRDVHKDVSQADVAPGGQFDYTLTIPNRGPCTLTDVVVTDTLTGPEGHTVTADPAESSRDGNTLVWNVGTLEPEETYTITLTIQVPEGAQPGEVFSDQLHAQGVCDGEPVEQDRGLDLPVVTDQFAGPCDLSLSNKSASHLEVIPGQTFNYFVHVFNRGAEDCSDVSVTDTLDERLEFVSCTDSCSNTGQTVTWSGETVRAGSGTTYTVTVLVRPGSEGTLANTATIDSPDDDGDPVTVNHTGPEITDQSVLAPPDPPSLVPGDLPRTGGELPRGVLAGLGLLGLAGLLVRRRMLAG